MVNIIGLRGVPEARADLVANQVELAWLTRYPIPNTITVDRGKEFQAGFKIMMENDYGILCYCISIWHPLVNAIVERVHQSIGNNICNFTNSSNPLGKFSLVYYVCHTVYGAHCCTVYTFTIGIW